jgi:hypothetical protein
MKATSYTAILFPLMVSSFMKIDKINIRYVKHTKMYTHYSWW